MKSKVKVLLSLVKSEVKVQSRKGWVDLPHTPRRRTSTARIQVAEPPPRGALGKEVEWSIEAKRAKLVPN